MSIHQSKGLEFPIVVVPDLNRKQDLPRKPVAFHPELGPLVRPAQDRRPPTRTPSPDDDEGSGRSLGWVAYEAVERRRGGGGVGPALLRRDDPGHATP